jgi:P-type conjugative transfer protein TrbJ
MKSRERKVSLILSGTVVTLVTVITPVAAVSGVGDIVYDPSNYAANIQAAVNSVTQLENQYRQIENDFIHLANEAKNLAPDMTTINGLRVSFQNLMAVNNHVRGLVNNYAQAQAAWDRTFPGYAKYNGKSALDSALEMQAALDEGNNSLSDSIMINNQAISDLATDQAQYEIILSSIDSADGELKAAQLGAKMAAMQEKQLLTLTNIAAKSSNAQMTYYGTEYKRQMQAEQEKNSMQALKSIGTQTTTPARDPMLD